MHTRSKRLPLRGDSSQKYFVELVAKALDIMDVLRQPDAKLRLTDIANLTKLDLSTTFRILRTLENRGYVKRDPGTKRFRLSLGFRTYRVAYAAATGKDPFARAVTRGLLEAAPQHHVELLVSDNNLDPQQAVENAEWIIQQKPDFAIEYQVHYAVAPLLAEMFAGAKIPTLAIDVPQPGAIYFGVNNYQVGLTAGEALGNFALKAWRGQVDRVVMLEFSRVGRYTLSRMIGSLEGIYRVLPHLNRKRVVHRDVDPTELGGYQATMKVLRATSPRERLLIAAINDACALGALRAVREAGRGHLAAIIGQGYGGAPRLEAQIRKSDSPLIGSVAYFPEKYGSKILPIVVDVLQGRAVRPSIHTEHRLITKENIDQILAPVIS